jgi:hypothetical protein
MSDTIGFSKDALIAKGQETGWDARKIVMTITGVTLACVALWYIIPFLLTIAWGLVELGIAGFIIFVMIVAFKWLKKWMWAINKFIAKYTLGLIVEWDEFIIQEQQIDQAEEDVEGMLKEKEKIEGKYIELSQKIRKNQEEFKENMHASQIAARNGDSEQAEDFTLAAGRNQTYVETIGPIADDMKFIIDFSQELHKTLKRKIRNAKADLEANKDVFYSAQSGARMLSSAKKAMIGDVELNNNAEFAKQKVKEKIALSIGQMRTSMEILSQVSNEQNYRDKAKMELAKERLKAINASGGEQAIVPQQSVNFQAIPQLKKYGDLL